MKNLSAIVLAAGKGTRMKSALPKVLHPLCGYPMLHYPLSALQSIKASKTVTVVGHKADEVKEAFAHSKTQFVLQNPQNGTGHAVMTGLKGLKDFKGDILVLSGDVPLIRPETLKSLLKLHRSKINGKESLVSFITVLLDDPHGYGRVIRDSKGEVSEIVEQKDLKGTEDLVHEINSGIYVFSSAFLNRSLKKLSNNNAQKEYYLTDLIRFAEEDGINARALQLKSPEEIMGINNRVELAKAANIMKERIAESLMLSGVTIHSPSTAYIDSDVTVGQDTVLYPNVYLEGNTKIGKNCLIEEGVKLKNVTIGENCHIKSHSIIEDSKLAKAVIAGPFARIRPGSIIDDNAHIGNFVEIKKSKLGKGSKANHLSYIGDSIIGKNVNIGAGVITCNYDGVNKHITRIEDNAFIGSDSQLVAPVKVGRGAYVGSGSTITKDVPSGKLALTRSEQKTLNLKKKAKKK